MLYQLVPLPVVEALLEQYPAADGAGSGMCANRSRRSSRCILLELAAAAVARLNIVVITAMMSMLLCNVSYQFILRSAENVASMSSVAEKGT